MNRKTAWLELKEDWSISLSAVLVMFYRPNFIGYIYSHAPVSK